MAKLDPSVNKVHSQAVATGQGLVEPGAVFDQNAQQGFFTTSADDDPAWFEHLRNPVLDGVLDNRLQRKSRQAQLQQIVGNGVFDLQTLGETRQFMCR